MYGKYGDVKVYHGKKQEYLGINFNFSEKGKVKIDMCIYISNMVKDFREYIKKDDYAATPAGNNIYERDDSPELDKKRIEEFHTFVAKVLFACQRTRPDIHLAVAVLTTRVKNPNKTEWKKLI